ncbi:helix-turn-helix domain-containing protein [Paenibacillus sp. ALE1]
METLGERINFARTKRGLTLKDLAAKLQIPVYDKNGQLTGVKNYTDTSLSYIENNKQRPSIDVMVAISDCLGVSIDWLARGEEYRGVKMETYGQERLKFLLNTTPKVDLDGFDEFIQELRNNLMLNNDKIEKLEEQINKIVVNIDMDKKEDSK